MPSTKRDDRLELLALQVLGSASSQDQRRLLYANPKLGNTMVIPDNTEYVVPE